MSEYVPLELKPEAKSPVFKDAQPSALLGLSLEEKTWRNEPQSKEQQAVPRAALQLYLDTQSEEIWKALRAHLARFPWEPAARVQWDASLFLEKLVALLHDEVMQTSKNGSISIEALEKGTGVDDLVGQLTPLLPICGLAAERAFNAKEWVPAFGIRCGQLVQASLAKSLKRILPRYVDAIDARAEEAQQHIVHLTPNDIVASSKLDRLVARALLPEGVSEVVPDASRHVARAILRPLRLTWEGVRDPKLWNWVRADIADASPEEVSAALFGSDPNGELRTYFATQIAVASPLFGIPSHLAALFPEALATAPFSVRFFGQKQPDAKDTIDERLAVLAETDVVEDVALQQAGNGEVATGESILRALDDAQVQLEVLRKLVVPWGLSEPVRRSEVHLASQRSFLASGSADRLHAFGSIAFSQRERLGRIIQEVQRVSGLVVPDRENPLASIVSTYVDAARTAQLFVTSEDLIAKAATAESALTIRSLQENQVALSQASRSAPSADKLAADDASEGARSIENRLLGGETVSPHDVERVELQLQEVTLRNRLHSVQIRLDDVETQSTQLLRGIVGGIAATNRFSSVPLMADWLRRRVQAVLDAFDEEQQSSRPRAGDADGLDLGGQVKTGQSWTGQNRPVAPGREVRVARGQSGLQVVL